MKIVRNADPIDVVYTDDQWETLHFLRKKATPILEALQKNGMTGYVYGSVARGDVSPTSDIDIFIYEMVSSFKVDLAFSMAGIEVIGKELSMATPSSIIKGIYYLPDEVSVSIRLTDFTSSPFQFYIFGGCISLDDIRADKRVPGVNKALMVISPTLKGHRTYSLMGHENEARELLKIENKMLEERIRVLEKRDKVGRTGVFLKEDIDPKDQFEAKLEQLGRKNSLIRRRMNFK